jgi:hypothetical protein
MIVQVCLLRKHNKPQVLHIFEFAAGDGTASLPFRIHR